MQDRSRQFDEIFLQRTAGPYIRVKNGPDALEMGCLYYPRKQTSVGYAADCDVKEVGAQGSGYNNFLNARAATWVDATKH